MVDWVMDQADGRSEGRRRGLGKLRHLLSTKFSEVAQHCAAWRPLTSQLDKSSHKKNDPLMPVSVGH